jgi:hypothetical protein
MDERPISGPEPPTVPRGAAVGAALVAVGALFVWAGWAPLFDGDFDRADLFGIVAVVCGVITFLGGLMIVVGIAFTLVGDAASGLRRPPR